MNLKKRGYRPCPKCGEYCPIIKKHCPICEFVFPLKEKKEIIPRVVKENYLTEKELAKEEHRNKNALHFPAEYDEYEIRGVIGTPAGECPIKLPSELSEREISMWVKKVRLKYLEQKRFITNKGLIYLARKFIDWQSPEFKEVKEIINQMEDYRKGVISNEG